MNIREEFKLDVVHAEGYKDKVYLDTEGKLTAGVGHLLTHEDMKIYNHVGQPVAVEDIDNWFDEDCGKVIKSAKNWFKDFNQYPDMVQLAILNWLYQLGTDAPTHFPKAREHIRNHEWSQAAMEWKYANSETLRLSRWWHQTPHRCQQECDRLIMSDTSQGGNTWSA